MKTSPRYVVMWEPAGDMPQVPAKTVARAVRRQVDGLRIRGLGDHAYGSCAIWLDCSVPTDDGPQPIGRLHIGRVDGPEGPKRVLRLTHVRRVVREILPSLAERPDRGFLVHVVLSDHVDIGFRAVREPART